MLENAQHLTVCDHIIWECGTPSVQNLEDPAELAKVQLGEIVWVRMNVSRIRKGISTCDHMCLYYSLLHTHALYCSG